MDISPRQDSRHSQDSLSPSLLPQNHPNSNAHLATLLADAYRDAESLRKELLQARKATEKAERVYQILNSADVVAGSSPPSMNSTTNGDSSSSSSHHKMQIKMIIEDYERRIARAEAQRDEADERRREAVEAVRMLDELLSALDREGRSYIRPILALDASTGSPSSSTMTITMPMTTRTMAPPSLLPARQLPRQNPSRLAPFSLPPHPSTHSPSASTSGSNRRPRTPSIDGLYSAAQPPSKKARPTDESRGREPRGAYSESYISNMPSQEYNNNSNGRPILPHPQRSTVSGSNSDPKTGGPRIINRDYRGMPPSSSSQRPNSHSRSESHSSASSMDVDEMILKATVGDDGAPTAVGGGAGGIPGSSSNGMTNGRHYPDSPQHLPSHLGVHHHHHQQQQQIQQQQAQQVQAQTQRSSRRLIDRDTTLLHAHEDPTLHHASGGSGSPYPQQPAGNSGYPANQVRGSGGAGAGGQGSASGSQSQSQSHVYTTHVFAPPMTGAPTKKSKFPNSGVVQGVAGGTGSPVPGSGPSIDSTHPQQQQQQQHQPQPPSQPQPTAIPPLVPFAATNEKGQRICRQCGIVGRYKDGKCVEKWGPGPCGPGTVCDRCRKKMKRVERRGTMESQQQQQQQLQQQQHLAMQAQQPQQHQPRPASHGPLPSSQGSDRSVQRSDTLLTTHASLGSSSSSVNFGASRSDLRDRGDESVGAAGASAAAQLRPSSGSVSGSHASGAQNAIATAATGTRGSGGGSQRHQPTPPSITALREQYDEDEDEDEDDILLDKDQLPTSNIGRGGSAAAAVVAHSSRSSSRNGHHGVRSSGTNNNGGGSSSNLKRSGLGTKTSASSSRAPSDEVDADADADAEAEAEAEILGAVDAAAGGGDRDEDEEEEEEEGDGEGDMEADADADAELLEAVDAAEANSNGSSAHGGERSWMKSES